jgi:hypothetical protein
LGANNIGLFLFQKDAESVFDFLSSLHFRTFFCGISYAPGDSQFRKD